MTDAVHVVPATAAGTRLVDHVRAHLGVVASRVIGPTIAAGGVLVDGEVGRIAEPLDPGAVLTLAPGTLDQLRGRRLVSEPSPAPLTVVHEDDHLLVVDKPAGVHVHPMGRYRGDTLLGSLLWHAGARPDDPWTSWRPHLVHRLDRPTSGLVLVAKEAATADALQLLLDDRRVERTYTALVEGDLAGEGGTIAAPIGREPGAGYRRAVVPLDAGGRDAVTAWRVLERRAGRTLVELRLATGRTHQIRVHLAALGHPVVGDSLYAGDGATSGSSPTSIELRAVRLRFPHPLTGATLDLVAATPAEGG